MPYVQLPNRPEGIVRRIAWRSARKRFGEVVDPLLAASRHAGVLVAMWLLEEAAGRGWRRLDPHLRWFAIQAASGSVGCSWCVDFGFYEGVHGGVDRHKVEAVARWRDSDLFDERERCILEYAEAASAAPSRVGPELMARLHEVVSEEEMVELAAWVALENFRSRFNAGLGLVSQGFAARCDLAPAAGRG